MYPAAGHYGPLVHRFMRPAEAFSLPPIQMHNFSSRPLTIVMTDVDNVQEGAGKRTEYHHFYGTPYFSPYWYAPPANPAAYAYPPYCPYGAYFPQQPALGVAGWQEGFAVKGELHWGKMGRVFGPKRELPDFVQDELRRVYGTYPRTMVTVSYQNGEFLIKGDPRVGEQKYKMEKKIVRRLPTPSDEESDSISEVVEKRKRKSKR